MKGRTPNKNEKVWLNHSHLIPCLACSIFHDTPDTPAEYHHIRGKTKEGAHLNGFSLCASHHRHKDNEKPPRWISRHGDGKAQFEARYMPENGFLEEQKRKVMQLKRTIIDGNNPANNGK
jgi:hypothetical protein